MSEIETELMEHLLPLTEEFHSAGIIELTRSFLPTTFDGIVGIEFRNIQSGRSIKIKMNRVGIMGTDICHQNGSFFTLAEYMHHHDRLMEERALFLIGEDIPRYLAYLRKVIREDLTPILLGERWEKIDRDLHDY